MRVAHLVPQLSRSGGGLVLCARDLIQALQDDDVKIEVFSAAEPSTDTDKSSWTSFHLTLSRSIGPAAFGFAPRLLEALRDADVDLVHTHGLWTFLSMVATKWRRETGRPNLVSPHGMLDQWALRNSRIKKQLAGFVFEKNHLAGAACIHALSQAEADSIREYGLSNPICLIPNGVEIPALSPTRLAPPWDFGVSTEKKVLLFLGRIHPKKGLSNLLQALAELRKFEPHREKLNGWVLCIAGWDEMGHEESLRAQTDKLGLKDNVRFIGPLIGERRESAYRNADAFVLPSLSEGLPVSVLEAWAFGLPVIMTKQCNLPEGEEAGAAILTEPDPESLAAALKCLLVLSTSDLELMGCRGRALVEERFGWSKIAEQMLEVYEWMLGRRSPPSCVHVG